MTEALSYPASGTSGFSSSSRPSLIFPAGTSTDLFTNYKPSTNAHVDFLSPGGGSALAQTAGVKTVRLNLRVRPAQPSAKDLLSTLLPSIPLILASKPTETSFHALSAACHRLVLPPHSLGPTIYSKVHEELEKSVAGLAREWRGSIMAREAGWLQRLVAGWTAWEARVAMLSAVFVYLDRVYSNESTGIASIRDLAIATFRKGIWDNELIFQKTRDEFLTWAAKERETGVPDVEQRPTIIALTILAKLLDGFSVLWVPYRDTTREHYAVEAASGVDSKPATAYIQWALDKVEEERERTSTCVDVDGTESVVGDVRKEVGTKVKDKVVRRAMDEAMDKADQPALTRLYKFAVDTDTFRDFSTCLQAYIENRLQKLISDPANDPQMIDETLKLKRFSDQAIEALFHTTRPPPSKIKGKGKTKSLPAEMAEGMDVDKFEEDDGSDDGSDDDAGDMGKKGREMEAEEKKEKKEKATKEDEKKEVALSAPVRTMQLELQDAIRTGFKAGMGSRQNAPAEWIAKHLDSVMRRGQGSGTESAFSAQLDEIIALIGYTRDKDVFKAFYSTQLAKRLLLNKSASDDMERNMIVKLQKEMGEEFTTGDVMMKDLALSETLLKSYQTHLSKTSTPDPTHLSANVLTESAWPAYPLLKDGWAFKLTPELQGSVDQFNGWYATQHKNRTLSWRWQLATVTLTGRFGSAKEGGGAGKYEIGVSLFQAVVLLAFNEDDELDFKELQARTGIESSELARTLQSLSLGRKGTRVLTKSTPTKTVAPTDIFSFNTAFTSDKIRFKINQIQQDLSAEESKKTNEQVAVDRVSVLEATIVRIMKGRKKSTMAGLVDLVVGDVSKRFPPDVKEIKRRVENLIEREFLMRDAQDKNVLHYLA